MITRIKRQIRNIAHGGNDAKMRTMGDIGKKESCPVNAKTGLCLTTPCVGCLTSRLETQGVSHRTQSLLQDLRKEGVFLLRCKWKLTEGVQ